jgi:ribonuclease-3 family protein
MKSIWTGVQSSESILYFFTTMRQTVLVLITCSLISHNYVKEVRSFLFLKPLLWKCCHTPRRLIEPRIRIFAEEEMNGENGVNAKNVTSIAAFHVPITATKEFTSLETRTGVTTISPPSSLEVLHRLLSPIDTHSVDQMTPAALAYIGDVVFELFARCRYVWPNRRMSSLQDVVVNVVRAEAQADLLANLTESFALTNRECHILMRGRNAGGKRSGSRGSIYQDATALEALIGYTYITDPSRCSDILQWIQHRLDETDIK